MFSSVAFENESFSTRRMKRFFICNLWSWANVYNMDRNKSLLNFLTWIG